MTEAERKVRAAWEKVYQLSDGSILLRFGLSRPNWKDALEFTEARQREIEDIKRSIAYLEGDLCDNKHCERCGAYRGMLQRENAILAEKRRA